MKNLKIKFNFKGRTKVWYPFQSLMILMMISSIIISPMAIKKTHQIIKEAPEKINNYIEQNYEIDDRGTPGVYDDKFIRIYKGGEQQ